MSYNIHQYSGQMIGAAQGQQANLSQFRTVPSQLFPKPIPIAQNNAQNYANQIIQRSNHPLAAQIRNSGAKLTPEEMLEYVQFEQEQERIAEHKRQINLQSEMQNRAEGVISFLEKEEPIREHSPEFSIPEGVLDDDGEPLPARPSSRTYTPIATPLPLQIKSQSPPPYRPVATPIYPKIEKPGLAEDIRRSLIQQDEERRRQFEQSIKLELKTQDS